MDSEVICNPKKSTHSLTHSVNNIGLRDASASKNPELTRVLACPKNYSICVDLCKIGAVIYALFEKWCQWKKRDKYQT